MSQISRRDFAAMAGAGLSLGLASCSASSISGTSLKLAHTLNSDHPVHKGMEFMGETLKELSGGSMGVDIYSNGQIGSLAMTKVSAISVEGFSPSMKLFSIPYLFKDKDHYWRVLNSELGKNLLDSLRRVRLQGLGYYDAGSRSFYMSETPVRSPVDLAGKKIRVLPSRTAIDMIEAMGGAATPMPSGELYTALQQGVVDGAENNPPSYYLSKDFEVAPYYTLDEHSSVPDILIMSRRIYDGFSDQQREWVQDAMAASVLYQRKLWSEAEQLALKEVAKAGVEIIYPDKQPFRDAVAPMKASFLESELGPLIRQIEAMETAS